jgi:hypothetical protein
MVSPNYCYTPVCGHGEVSPEEQAEFTLVLCNVLRATIAAAGGGGYLEESPCPHVVVSKLKVNETDTVNEAFRKLNLCHKLGITSSGFLEEN